MRLAAIRSSSLLIVLRDIFSQYQNVPLFNYNNVFTDRVTNVGMLVISQQLQLH